MGCNPPRYPMVSTALITVAVSFGCAANITAVSVMEPGSSDTCPVLLFASTTMEGSGVGCTPSGNGKLLASACGKKKRGMVKGAPTGSLSNTPASTRTLSTWSAGTWSGLTCSATIDTSCGGVPGSGGVMGVLVSRCSHVSPKIPSGAAGNTDVPPNNTRLDRRLSKHIA